jgi:hypothetical protein
MKTIGSEQMNAHATTSNKSGICKSRRITAERNAAVLFTKRAFMKAREIEAGEMVRYREMWNLLRK